MVNEWGFYAHRKINYYAALTIPPPANQFFKSHINYLREHAVDPDRRRYAVPGEAERHFIDMDQWFRGDSLVLTRDYSLDRMLQGHWEWETDDSTILVKPDLNLHGGITFEGIDSSFTVDSFALQQEVYGAHSDSTVLIADFLYPDQHGRLYFYDSLRSQGIVPYHVERLYHRLVREMQEKDLMSVIKTCTDMGHYISDAHVPLHTNSNYNGQFTDQLGIHSFWESRIPELFEESYFNSLVGRAQYIDDIHTFIWQVVEHSFSLVPEVLEKEREARENIGEQHHYCYEERGNAMVRTPCPRLAREYMNLMDGMVQEQWRAAIRAVGSIWYSAWVDSGEPDLWSTTIPTLPTDTSFMDRLRNTILRSSDHKRSDLH